MATLPVCSQWEEQPNVHQVLNDYVSAVDANDLYGQGIKNNLSVELFFWSEQDKSKIKDNYKQI